jgi:hypothetical protein
MKSKAARGDSLRGNRLLATGQIYYETYEAVPAIKRWGLATPLGKLLIDNRPKNIRKMFESEETIGSRWLTSRIRTAEITQAFLL